MVSRYASTDLVPDTLQFPLDNTDNLYSGKLTWNIAASSNLVASVFADPTTSSGANLQPIENPDPGTWESARSIGGIDYGLRLNQLLSASGLLTLQVARHQDQYSLLPSGQGLQVRFLDLTCPTGKGTPDHPCDIPGEPNFVEGGLGFIDGPTNHSKSHRDQVRADATLYRGSHELKLGGDYQDGQTDELTFRSGGQVVRRFDELGQVYYQHSFFAKSMTDLTPVDAPNSAITRDAGAYLQDSWKAAPDLTINAGLRFDREWVLNYLGEAVIATTVWQPRVGVVWDPLGEGTSKVYAFAGRFSYGLPTAIAIDVWGSRFNATTFNFDRTSVTPDLNVINHETSIQGGPLGDPVDKGLKGASVDELTLGAEKTFGGKLSLGLKATYRSLSNTIEDRCDLDNTVPENNSSCAITNPGSQSAFARGAFYYCTGLDQFSNCNPDAYTRLYGAPPLPAEAHLPRHRARRA